jgi:uncharacterized RDD family membrane protein YckC
VYLTDTRSVATFPSDVNCARISLSRWPQSLGNRPQRKNVTVILTCKQCGAVNRAETGTCCFCDARLSQNTTDRSVSASARLVTEGNLAVAPDWRSEVSSRLKAYRARHNRIEPEQPALFFGDADDQVAAAEAEAAAEADARDLPADRSYGDASVRPESSSDAPAGPAPVSAARWRQSALARPDPATTSSASQPIERAKTESAKSARPAAERPSLGRLEIDVAQPAFDFRDGSRAEIEAWNGEQRSADRPWRESLDSTVFPVASLAQRRLAGLLDTALLLFSYGAFLSLFVALGGRFEFSKLSVAVVGSTLVLFYVLYVGLFTFFGGTTPGMMLRHLRVVSFDGSDPAPAQLLWRSFGYLISAGTLLFGFLAALWDEDALCWHDRISQTYLTSSDRVDG